MEFLGFFPGYGGNEELEIERGDPSLGAYRVINQREIVCGHKVLGLQKKSSPFLSPSLNFRFPHRLEKLILGINF